MVVYQLILQNTPANLNKKVHFIDDKNDELKTFQENTASAELPVDFSYARNKYGIDISEQSIYCFNRHRMIWKLFKESGRDCCLVIEDKTVPQISMSECMDYLNDLPQDWDIFFPFDKSEELSIMGQPFVLGHYWGSFIYFLSKTGVEKLLEVEVIRQEVDEEILTLSMDGKLNIYVNETEGFFEDSISPTTIEQKQSAIRDAIFGINVWSDIDKMRVRKALQILSDMAKSNDIDLILDSGTLLGYIRHNEIIPWDDDIDLAIELSQAEKLLSVLWSQDQLITKHTSIEMLQTSPIKIWMDDGDVIDGHTHLFPFIDLWLYTVEDKSIVFKDGRTFPYSDFYPLENCLFENVPLKIPFASINCLNRQYIRWDKEIQIFRWSHRKEKQSFHPLNTSIEVDSRGRMIKQ